MKIEIVNFQPILSATLEFNPGLTVIVGPSNNGKTSIYRALEAAIYNNSGDHVVTQGKFQSAVRLTDSDFSLTWKRDLGRSSPVSYLLNGEVLQKVGRGQPSVIGEALRMQDVSFSRTKERLNMLPQMSYPFLLDKPPSQLYEFFVISSDEESLVGIAKDMNTDLRSLESDKKVKFGILNELKTRYARNKEKYELYNGFDDLYDRILKASDSIRYYLDLLTLTQRLQSRLESVHKYEEALSQLEPTLKLAQAYVSDLDHLQTQFSLIAPFVRNLSFLISKYKDASMSYSSLSSRIVTTERVLANVGLRRLDSLHALIVDVCNYTSSLKESISGVNHALRAVENLHQRYEEALKEQEVCRSQLESFDECPLCGSLLKGD